VTQYNPFFWGAVFALEWVLLLAYISLVTGFVVISVVSGLLALGLAVSLIIIKPKRLISNQYYTEGAETWTRSATA